MKWKPTPTRSLAELRRRFGDWLDELRNPDFKSDKPREISLDTAPQSLSKKELLEKEMAEAVEREDYERAAEVRDELKELENSGASR